jgi:transcriptional regulator with XRE-family HTH domain
MSKISENLTARRDALGMTNEDVVAELAKRGIDRAYSTVTSWFNGTRGSRWNMEELKALLDVLQTDLDTITQGEVELIEERVPAITAREMRDLSEEQQQAVLAIVRSMRGKV